MASPAEAAHSRVGARVAGKYRLTRLLGVGGMGAVYEAEHAVTGRRVAVKVLHAELASRKGFAARFLREAQSASSIGHPGIIDVLDAGTDTDGTLYLVLELLSGEDLGAALVRGVVDVLLLVRVARELLSALEAAHARNIVHRDLKPENVYLARTADGGRVKLLDFGIAKQVGIDENMRLTTTGTVLGTPYYMSPEQARGKEVDGRSDLWSLGAVLFDALTGRPPFGGENYNELIAAILTDPIPSLGVLRPELPAELVAIVDRALVRDRAARWQSAAEMKKEFDALMVGRPMSDPLAQLRAAPRTAGVGSSASGIRELGSGDPPLVGPDVATAHTSVDGTRRRWLVLGGVAVVAVALIVGLAFALGGGRASPEAPHVATPTPQVVVSTPPPPATPIVLSPLDTPPVAHDDTPPPGHDVRPHPHRPPPRHRPTDPIRSYVPH